MKPSIFNDVIGPVMRGPSSSHTAATWRIARVCLDILNEPLKQALIEFDRDGAWSKNYREQGTAMGINGGLLGIDITETRMKDIDKVMKERGLSNNYEISTFVTQHVNTLRITLEGTKGNNIRVLAASLGGGSFKIYQFNDHDVDIRGNYYELLLLFKNTEAIPEDIRAITPGDVITTTSTGEENILVNIKSPQKIPADTLDTLSGLPGIDKIIPIDPVLTIVSGNETKLPFDSIPSLIKFAESESMSLGDTGLLYERCLSGLSDSVLIGKMKDLVTIIENSIETGLAGTNYEDRILHQQSHLISKAVKDGKISPDTLVNSIISYVTAIMEVKSSMETFVANPTAGSCGTVGGVLKAVSDELKSSKEELIKAYFAAGIVGVYFAKGPGFSAEEHGCQVECGAASGMAAAAIVQLFGGTARQAIDAASMAIQNLIGLICDPVADRVEVPCLGKNVNAAVNAYASASMVCSGYNAVIPLEEVIETVSEVSKQMPSCVKCTGQGGLAITKTALDLKSRLTVDPSAPLRAG
jgi:L-serine dehydratase